VDPTHYNTYWLFADDIRDVIRTSPAKRYNMVNKELQSLLNINSKQAAGM
jgi:hypothetical protein